MNVSVFELFKKGIGPSSSHTVGPMVAAGRFLDELSVAGRLMDVDRILIELFGSLALTGIGHGTDKAVLLGLTGETPDAVDPDFAALLVEKVRTEKQLLLGGRRRINFDPKSDLILRKDARLPGHSNAMRFVAFAPSGAQLLARQYYSVGGGFVVGDSYIAPAPDDDSRAPYPFANAKDLLFTADQASLSIAEIQLLNELAATDRGSFDARLDQIWAAMRLSIDRGCREEGLLPGGLNLKRRAAELSRRLAGRNEVSDPLIALDWVKVWALAVNEENAAGGRIVTAPTMGAAGIIPAVIRYYEVFAEGTNEGIRKFLLTAAAIGGLYKANASISGAEVGCQGEIGVACSMAAAGLTAALGGTNAQIENAAEIGMEHNLGLTCDPVGSLVQIPCIERNAIGAVKAIDASRLALLGDGTHRVSLDEVIETMRKTGADMKDAYKETSLGGLAANVTMC